MKLTDIKCGRVVFRKKPNVRNDTSFTTQPVILVGFICNGAIAVLKTYTTKEESYDVYGGSPFKLSVFEWNDNEWDYYNEELMIVNHDFSHN